MSNITENELMIAKERAKAMGKPVFAYWVEGKPICPICYQPLTQSDACSVCGVEIREDETVEKFFND